MRRPIRMSDIMTAPSEQNDEQNERPTPTATATPSRRRWVPWTILAILATAGVVLTFFPPESLAPGGEDKRKYTARTPAEELTAQVARNPGYLGPQACAPCHAERVAQMEGGNHFRACREPRLGDMPRSFDAGPHKHPSHYPDVRFEMNRRDGDFLQNTFQQTEKGERSSTARIDFVYGAGPADEIYFSWTGDKLYELPVSWLHPLECWGNTPFARHGPDDFSRTTNPRCLECHNTWFAHVPGTSNQYHRDNFILGVTCERCHGPGREHVEFHKANPKSLTPHAVVRPARLSRERQIEVCIQCHSNAVKYRGPAFSYRPGEPLADHYRTISTTYPENDRVGNQIQYLRRSKCFEKSDMTCTTCHNPHRSMEGAAVRRACAKCHEPAECKEQARLPAAVREQCAECHMPQRFWVNVNFHIADGDRCVAPGRRSEHRIAVYPDARDAVVLAWQRSQKGDDARAEATRLAKGLVSHWLAESEKRRETYRFLAAITAVREALRVEPAADGRARLQKLIAAQTQIDSEFYEALYLVEKSRHGEAIDK